jgi:hypothetical protein
LRVLTRILLTATALGCALVASAAAVLAYPQPLFAHYVETDRLALHADRPFDPDKGRRVLADAERRIGHSVLDRRDGKHRVFVAHSPWRARLVFLWNYGAGGMNYHPLTRNVFIRASDIDADRVVSSLGPVPPPRTLAYYIAHEVGHSLISERIGALANWRLPRWVREGLADYIAFAGAVDIDQLTAQLRAGARELDPQRSGLYARYRLLVAHMLEREGWTLDRLLASRLPQAEAERGLLQEGGADASAPR